MKVKYKYQYIVGTISAPLLFWLCGAPAILLPIFIAISSFTKGNRGKYAILNLIPLVTYIAFGVIGVRTGLIGSFNHFLNHTVTKLPLKTLREAQPMVMVGWVSTIIVALYGILQNRFEKLVEYGWLNQTTQFALVVVMGGVVLFAPDKQYSAGITFKEYNKWAKLHYLYTQQEYKQLLNLYKTEAPDGTIESNYINLALYKEGRLMDDFFKYSPTNHISLLIRWADAPFPIAFLWGEVSSEMGFILKSCQTAYEGNVLSGPRGSSAFTKILVESEIILGNYKTADKYISNLENTIFYKDWATSQREFLSDKAVSQNDYYRVKRKCLLKDNAVMALTDELKLMEHIYRVNPAHKSTYNFATLMTLSSGAIPAFREVISIGMESRHFMPPFHKIIQEGLTVAYNQYPVFWNFYKIDENIQKQYLEFGKAVKERNANPMGANAVISKNQNRYWYYIETLRQRSQQANQNTIETTTELPNN